MAKLKLSRFNLGQAIVDLKTGSATTAFLRWINDTVSTIGSAYNDLDQLVQDIAFSLQQSGIAIQTAQEAKAAAMASAREAALVNSYVDPSDAITTTLDGTAGKITIADHTRRYGDGTSVSVIGGSITGLALSSQYYIFYLDPARTGGAVTYSATVDPSAAGQGVDRHLVGGIVTPNAQGEGGGGGGTTRPPGIPYWKFPDQEMPVVEAS